MPAKDEHHDIVIHCLKQAGWTIIKEQEYLSVGTSSKTHRRLFIDIKAQHNQGQIVLIEVKSLDRSPVHQLMELLGQYLVYKEALAYLDIDIPLYVAIPKIAYQTIIEHVLGLQVMNEYRLSLVIYDPVEEEILEWIPSL